MYSSFVRNHLAINTTFVSPLSVIATEGCSVPRAQNLCDASGDEEEQSRGAKETSLHSSEPWTERFHCEEPLFEVRPIVGERERTHGKTRTPSGQVDEERAVGLWRDSPAEHACIAVQFNGQPQPRQHPPY